MRDPKLLDRLIAERKALDERIRMERKRRGEEWRPDWVRFLMDRISGSYASVNGKRIIVPGLTMPGSLDELYGQAHLMIIRGRHCPEMLPVLRAFVELEEARERGEIKDEVE